MAVIRELKRRKIVQWTLAYLAGAWVALQLVAILAGQFGWPAVVERGATVLLASGFFIALVVAWYHGEKGRQRVSGPELLMLAGILVVAGAAIALVRGEPAAETPGSGPGADGAVRATDPGPPVPVPERSIAVLPLNDLSPGDEHAYFAGAMTEEITTSLSKVPELRVTSRNSASKFPESGKTVREFARELGVAHVLEGSVQRVGDDVRITVQLIDARTDEHLWSETYERELGDVLEVQVEIAREVANRLAASFSDEETRRILAGATQDPVAYDLFLRAVEPELEFSGPGEVDETIHLLRRAVDRDHGFWLAWAELSFAFRHKSSIAGPAWIDSSRAALDRAIGQVDDHSVDAILRAFRARYQGEGREDAMARLREAVASRPSSYLLVMHLTLHALSTGDLPEAARWGRRAAALDPLSSQPWSMLGSVYATTGLYGRAERAIWRAVEVDPESVWPWLQLAFLETQRGRYAEAIRAADSLELRNSQAASAIRGNVRMWSGDMEGARSVTEDLPRSDLIHGPLGRLMLPFLAHLRSFHGDTAGASELLERAQSMLGSDPHPEGDKLTALRIAAVRGDAAAATEALRRYREGGGRNVSHIKQSPLFSRVRQDSAFRAELRSLEQIVERMRRQIERDLAAGR